ncbi:MAG: hypothetical protein LH630_05060 [Actinomycetia bacterium]|nr:hypothetical protein [Actinomycetes bacterium]
MPAPLTPVGSKVLARSRLVFLPAGASLTAPSLAILNGATALDITNIAYSDSGMYSNNINKGAAPRRLGQSKVQESFNPSQEAWGDLKYMIDPQSAALSDGRKAFEKFPEGTVGVFYWRPGISSDTDLAIGQFVIPTPITLGPRAVVSSSEDDAAEFAVTQGVIVISPGQAPLVAIVA